MNITRAKYFMKAKRLMVVSQSWVLTARVPSKGHLPSVLNRHGLIHRANGGWAKHGDIYTAEVKRA